MVPICKYLYGNETLRGNGRIQGRDRPGEEQKGLVRNRAAKEAVNPAGQERPGSNHTGVSCEEVEESSTRPGQRVQLGKGKDGDGDKK
jgi:hypothetical protein